MKTVSMKNEVALFISNLRLIINDENFDIDNDLDILLKKKHEAYDDPYTTYNTLLALNFDRYDVIDQLIKLDIDNYLETIIDDMDNHLPPFYAFAKQIQNQTVYIKLKIRNLNHRKIFVVSFHFARYPLNKPVIGDNHEPK